MNRLGIGDPHYVEIESKHRVQPEQAKDLHDYLLNCKNVVHKKSVTFFDQFLDTPGMTLFKKGCSLRLRYKGAGTRVYLQYKGPGFHRSGLLYRSEFSTKRLRHLVLEESHHDIVHFNIETIQHLLRHSLPPEMAAAMRLHLGLRTMKQISRAVVISHYQKDKFHVDMGKAALEPSIDRIFAFHISKTGLHPLSSFCEYENEIKSEDGRLETKIRFLDRLISFDRRLEARFDVRYERLDKYHRCNSFFMTNGTHRSRR